MRITFLCSSFEPGRDGVGDYVAQFASDLSRRGHHCQIIALADRFTESSSDSSTPLFDLVRIPLRDWRSDDIGIGLKALRRFAPDWVSLQMVSYGFEHRGLLWSSARRFARLGDIGNRHMMFHELWIGEAASSPLRDRMIGWLQKRLLLRAMKLWSPPVVHTSNALYRELLGRAGVVAMELAVPSNIPIRPADPVAARQRVLALADVKEDADSVLLAGVFGTVHREWMDTNWLAQLLRVCTQLGRRLALIHFGRGGIAGTAVFTALRDKLGNQMQFAQLGELSFEDVSIVLQGLDFGVATSAWPLVWKSGAVAAMLEHGLPVLVTRVDLRLRRGPTPEPFAHPLLLRLDDFCARLKASALKKSAPQPRLDVYETFLTSLQGLP